MKRIGFCYHVHYTEEAVSIYSSTSVIFGSLSKLIRLKMQRLHRGSYSFNSDRYKALTLEVPF